MVSSPGSLDPRPPRQFGLRSIFAITALVAGFLGIVHWVGFGPTIGSLLFAIAIITGYVIPARRIGKAIGVTGAILGAAVVLLILTELPRAHVVSPRSMCHCNLKQISLALWCYADVYGSLPPAYIADKSGRPMHSWRVLILPFIEQRGLYDRYDFNEPWDGPHNRLLAKHIPPQYRCPSEPPWPSPETSYLAVTGKATVWPGTHGTALSKVSDGLGDTIAVVEVASSGVHWMAPRDLPMAEFVKGINRPSGKGASSPHPSGCHAACCDGRVWFLQAPTSTATLKALATRAGGEPLPHDKDGNLIAK